MGRSSLIVRWAFIFIAVSLIAGLTGCSSTSPTTNHELPDPGEYQSRARQPGFSGRRRRHPDLHRYPPEQLEHSHHYSGYVSFQQYRGPDHRHQRVGVRRHLGFADLAANLHSRSGWNGPGDRQVARGQQSPYNRVRASAHRQNCGWPGHGADPAGRPLLFQGPELQLPGQRLQPWAGHHRHRGTVHLAVSQH